MFGSTGSHKDRLEICFVDPLIDMFTKKIETNVEKAMAKKNRPKVQNLQHLISKLMRGSAASGAGQGAKMAGRGVAMAVGAVTATAVFPPGMVIAGGALATMLGLGKGAMAAWNIHEKINIGQQVNVIRTALHEHSEEKDIAALIICARKVITEVAHTLKFIFCQQLQNLQLERDLRSVALYAVSIIVEKSIWKPGECFDRNTVLAKLIDYQPDTIGRLSSMWDNRVRMDFGHTIKMSYFFYQPGMVQLETGNYFEQNVKHSKEKSESYGFRQPVLKQVEKNGVVSYVPHEVFDDPTCEGRPPMQPIRRPPDQTKHQDLKCQLFKGCDSQLGKCLYWYSGFQDQGNFADLSLRLEENQTSLTLVMFHQTLNSLPRDAFSRVKFEKSTFISCDFSTAQLIGTNFFYCSFINCRFNETIFDTCCVFKCNFNFCQLEGTEFRNGFITLEDDMGTDMKDVIFPGMTDVQKKEKSQLESSLTHDMSESSRASSISSIETRKPGPVRKNSSQSQLAIYDQELILDPSDDLDTMISFFMTRMRYMDPIAIIQKLKQEKDFHLGKIQLMEQSVQNVFSVEGPTPSGPWNSKENKALQFVDKNDMGGLVEFLQEHHVNINAVNRQKVNNSEFNLLFHAIEASHEEMGYTLLQAGVNPGFRNNLGLTALHLAARKGFTNLGRMVIEYKASETEMKQRINARNNYGDTALHIAIEEEQEEFVKMILTYGFINLEHFNKDYNTALHIACQKGHEGFIEMLIQAGANPTVENKKKQVPADLCKSDVRFDKKYLLDFSSDQKDWGENEKEACKLLKQNRLNELQQFLEKQEVNLDTFSSDQETENLLMTAIGMGNLGGVELLLEKGCNPDVILEGSTTSPLLLAASIPVSLDGKDMEDIAICILNDGTPKERIKRAIRADRQGKTTLHGACKTGKTELVKLLLEIAEVDVNAEMEDNWTPLHAAALAGHKEIIDMLIAKGADATKQAFNPYYGMVTPTQLDQYYNGATLEDDVKYNNEDDVVDDEKALSTDEKHSDSLCNYQEYGRNDTEDHFSLQDLDPAFVKSLATKCYVHDDVKPENMAQELLEEKIITLRMMPRVQRLAEGLQNGTLTPDMFVQRLNVQRQQSCNEELQSNEGSNGIEQTKKRIPQVIKRSSVSDTSTNSKVWGQNEDEAAKLIKSKQGGVLADILEDVHVNATTKVGDRPKTLLCLAVEYEFEEGVDLLLESGADPTWKSPFDGSTPLHMVAAIHGNCTIARKLIEFHAFESERCHRVNSQDLDGHSPLSIACQHRSHMDLINLLRGYHCLDVNKAATDPQGWTPLHQAAGSGHGDIVEVLLKAGANKSPQAHFEDDIGYGLGQITPADIALKRNYVKIVKLLK